MSKGPTRRFGAMFGTGAVETFLGLPRRIEADTRVAILGAPCATPYPSVGAYCAEGPAAIRAAIADYAGNLEHVDFDFGAPMLPDGLRSAADLGDLDWSRTDFAANRDTIRAAVGALLDRRVTPIVIGGEDSVPIPMLEAFEGRGRYVILQIDAHIDWRDEVGGERLGLSSPMRRASEMPWIEGIVQVGLRGTNSARPKDVADALAWGARLFPARALAHDGIGPVIDAVPEGAQVIVCFDADGLDPAIMPGVIARAPGGLGYWQAVELLSAVAEKASIAGVALTEFMPERDVDGLGALTAARLVAVMIGLAARAG